MLFAEAMAFAWFVFWVLEFLCEGSKGKFFPLQWTLHSRYGQTFSEQFFKNLPPDFE
jgi:hypothetical protein